MNYCIVLILSDDGRTLEVKGDAYCRILCLWYAVATVVVIWRFQLCSWSMINTRMFMVKIQQ